MHSSYALSADDFAVERGGAASSGLDSLWPGGWRPDDRLGRGAGESHGRLRLLQPDLRHHHPLLRPPARATRGTGNFFRYADNFLFGVGCEPGDFNQLDVWPLHKFVTLLQPTAEALIEAVTDRRRSRCWRCPRRAPAAAARSSSRPGTHSWRRCVASSPTRRSPAAPETPTCTWSETASSRATWSRRSSPRPASTPGLQARLRRLRRNLDREREAAGGELPDAGQPRRRPRAAGRHVGAAARPSGADPALDPDHDHAGRGADADPADAPPAPFDRAAAAALQVDRAGALRRLSGRAPAHRLRRGPAAAGRHLRRVGGLGLDLRLRRSRRRAPRGSRVGRDLGRVAASQVAVRGPGRAARRRPLLHLRHGRAGDRPVPLRRRSATSTARCSATASSTATATATTSWW